MPYKKKARIGIVNNISFHSLIDTFYDSIIPANRGRCMVNSRYFWQSLQHFPLRL